MSADEGQESGEAAMRYLGSLDKESQEATKAAMGLSLWQMVPLTSRMVLPGGGFVILAPCQSLLVSWSGKMGTKHRQWSKLSW
jgi:hypothetical protein